MALVSFPEPADLNLKFEDMVLDGRSVIVNPYNVSNPHPGFGKDPNILNEFGHSAYPKMIYPNGSGPKGGPGVVVNSAEEEAEVMKDVQQEQQSDGGTKKAW